MPTITIPPFQPIDFEDIINNNPTVNSSGYFKEIMESIDANIQKEFEENRLTGPDYATVYLGAMQYALDNVFKYVLAEAINNNQAALIWAQAQKTAEELELIKAQTQKVLKEINLLDLQYEKETIEKEIAEAAKEDLKIKPRLDNVVATNQAALLSAQEKLTTEKIDTENSQQNVLAKQVSLYGEQAGAFKAKHGLDVVKTMVNANAVRNSSLDISDSDTAYAKYAGGSTSALEKALKAIFDGSNIKWEPK